MCFKVIIGRQNFGTDEFLLQNCHEIKQIFGIAVSNVVYTVRRKRESILTGLFLGRTLHDALNAFDNIIHIGKIALAVAVVEYLYGLAL